MISFAGGLPAPELFDAFVPGAPFFAGAPDRATLRVSFTAHPPAEIAEGLARLRDCWD